MFSHIKPFIGIVAILSISFFFSTISFSQKSGSRVYTLNHPLNANPQKKLSGITSDNQFPETLYVWAARIQFTQYSDPNVTGDGTFDLSNNYPDSIDAPPHDSTYFLNHLEFLKNYYYRVSKGKLVIVYRLLGNVHTLPAHLGDYSPRRGENNLRLGNLFYDAWRAVDCTNGIFYLIDTTKKNAFVIFHSGVGKDVDLTSQGIFQGELDIPSLYMSNNSLKSLFGDTTRGFYSRSGIIIPSAAIIPEQENRVINGSFGNYFLELGINGILTASIGSYLGLPDLFNTQTGVTAIGRFGLMDGQSIFSFSGVFPPEPSAWEKMYLGWINPVVITQNGTFSSKAATIDDGNSSVYKVLISAKEYFLLENRNRDAHNTGVTVYYRDGTTLHSQLFHQDVSGFEAGDVWQLKKSIVDVDELDWSLPGLKDDTANFQGGLCIWHIDENVIDANIGSNTINNDINHRGVKLMEAKGSQDIGIVIHTPLGDFIGDGTPWDFWFNGQHYVPSNIYQNAFTPFTIPNSKSYSNFNSHVCLTNFGTIDSVISFHYEQCGPITNINNYPRYVGVDTTGNAQPIGFDFNGNGLDEVFVNVKDSLYGFRDNGNPIRVDESNGLLADSCSNFAVGYAQNSGGTKFVTGINRNQFVLMSFNIDSLTGVPNIQRFTGTGSFASPGLFINTVLFAGTSDGKVNKLDINSLGLTYDSITNHSLPELATGRNGTYVVTKIPYKYLTAGKVTGRQNDDTVIVSFDNKILLNDSLISGNLGISQVNSTPIVCDLQKNGHMDIIFCADDKVFAINQFGIPIDNFPFKANGVSKISSGCTVSDIDGDGVNEVIFGTGDGRIYAYNVNGKV
ncbi:MAG: hypothetical protein ACHQJ4_00235, partial [Ignavibacteria bacterium]